MKLYEIVMRGLRSKFVLLRFKCMNKTQQKLSMEKGNIVY